MDYETLSVSRHGHAALIEFNRPEALNALSTQMAKELVMLLEELSLTTDVWAVALTASGDRAFCVGADLKERKSMNTEEMRRQRELFVKAFQAVATFPKPIIAAVNGYAMGGGFEFALCCDFIICSDNAKFALPEVGLAIIPGGGGTQNLPRVIGKNKAKELIFTGRRIDAGEAERLGIVNHVTSLSELTDKALALLDEITKNGPVALKQAKKSVNLGVEMDLNTAFQLEAECYQMCLTTQDRDEGLKAFNEKRKPVYKGY
ncbi:enoyl-CoA hydratase-related protein [Metallumcola ferriviriculae]|uniref:short-chain-enoyl-CoA hydratase n=1 Tax=Metallumcola ferriviriculae TaxID=3039180 RepID=A0AAU0UNI0_9FIRM|nr:enoyl-CoA hydratase-related protein [Desulfitibacteraceae bacterium MK1]